MWVKFLIVFLSFTAIVENKSYIGYKVYDVTPKNDKQIVELHKLSQTSHEVDFWNVPRWVNTSTQVSVPPEMQLDFEEALNEKDIHFNVLDRNLGKSLTKNYQEPHYRTMSTGTADFTRYLRFNEITSYMNTLKNLYPDRVTVETAGHSYYNRPMNTIRISNGDGNTNKNVIFIDAGVHAREWLAPATAVYVIHQLVEKFSENKNLLKNFDWLILPLVNPDGYEFSHTDDHLWRKTLKPTTVRRCPGTDGNRNFDFHWAEVGTSAKACDVTYHGAYAFSESETQTVRDIMNSVKSSCKMYISLHSYGNYLLYPWGYTSGLPSNWRTLDDVAKSGADAILKATGTRYRVGSSTNVLYPAAGGSDDYALAVVGIPLAYTMELSSGGSGFQPSRHLIESLAKEGWIGIRAMAEKVNQIYSKSTN